MTRLPRDLRPSGHVLDRRSIDRELPQIELTLDAAGHEYAVRVNIGIHVRRFPERQLSKVATIE